MPLIPVTGCLLWFERKNRELLLRQRLNFLRRQAPKVTLWMKIPWRDLAGTESQLATAGVMLSLLAAFVFQLPGWFMVLQLLVVCPLAWLLVRRTRLRRLRSRFAERFPEAVDSLTRAVQAGVPVERALASMGDIFDGVMADRFRRLVQQLELGVPFRDALRNFSSSLNLPDVDFFCAVLALNRETGSQLSPMLTALSRTLREQRAVSRKLQALTAESRASARVLSFLPLFILGLQAFLNPGQLKFLLEDPAGRAVLGLCAASMAAGLFIIRRMSRLMEL
ncbi:MAG: type II secretion system F family protein [Candidatus Adiutrix sp.]|nr:type II secretion system F family protein [Candidatus Adiutrix sp.]